MSGKMYTLEVSERELARAMFVMGKANGITDGESVYHQAYIIFGLGHDEEHMPPETYRALHKVLGIGTIDYCMVQEEWEEALGIGKFKKSPAQQRIENLEKELDELKKLL